MFKFCHDLPATPCLRSLLKKRLAEGFCPPPPVPEGDAAAAGDDEAPYLQRWFSAALEALFEPETDVWNRVRNRWIQALNDHTKFRAAKVRGMKSTF